MKNIYVIFFFILVCIVVKLGFADNDNEKKQNESLIIQDSIEIPSINATPIIFQLQAETIPNINISGKILTCTYADGEQVVDLKISNHDLVNRSVTIYPVRKIIKLVPKYNLRLDIVIPTGIKTLTLVFDNAEEVKLSVPPCINGGDSGQDNFRSLLEGTVPNTYPEPAATPGPVATPDPTTIPEFPSVVFPVIAVLGLLLIMQRRK